MSEPIAFLTGCGRSGTSILGTMIGASPDVRYLNDFFPIWIEPFPQCDAWGLREGTRRRDNCIELTEDDLTDEGQEQFWEITRQQRQSKPLLVEKVALNNFRLRFLATLAPEAKMINIVRHGVEVARSIAKRVEVGQWYGEGDRKWHLLEDLARGRGLDNELALCTNHVARGLLEWRMSVEVAGEHIEAIGDDRVLQVRYEDLIADAPLVATRIADHLELSSGSAAMRAWAQGRIERKNPTSTDLPPPPEAEAIAGDALRSMGYNPSGGMLRRPTVAP
ncbi:MAG: sulfotransferase [Phycisphaera sp.]|nr:MAG: sulfotransferase [Phycisphaera sp.]